MRACYVKDAINLQIEIRKYNRKSLFGKILRRLKKENFRKGVLFLSSTKLKEIPIIHKMIPKFLILEKGRFEINICNEIISIPHGGIKIEKEGIGVNISVEIRNVNLDKIIENVASKNLEGNKMVSELVKDINFATNEEEKYELIQFMLRWINRNNIINVALESLIENNQSIAKKIKDYGLEFGNIELNL